MDWQDEGQTLQVGQEGDRVGMGVGLAGLREIGSEREGEREREREREGEGEGERNPNERI
jgi:hypothetical protein